MWFLTNCTSSSEYACGLFLCFPCLFCGRVFAPPCIFACNFTHINAFISFHYTVTNGVVSSAYFTLCIPSFYIFYSHGTKQIWILLIKIFHVPERLVHALYMLLPNFFETLFRAFTESTNKFSRLDHYTFLVEYVFKSQISCKFLLCLLINITHMFSQCFLPNDIIFSFYVVWSFSILGKETISL